MNHAPSNPFLLVTPHPDFARVTPDLAEPAVKKILAEGAVGLARLESCLAPTWAGLMQPLQELGEPLEFAWEIVTHMLGVMNSQAWRDVQEKLQPDVVAFSLRIGQSKPLYEGMLALHDGGASLTGVQQRILEAAIRAAQLAGVGLADAERGEFNEIQRELAELGTRFRNNVLDATKAYALTLHAPDEVEGLPPSLLAAAAQAARAAGEPSATATDGPWRITLDAPVLVPFLKYSCRRDLREQLYRAHITRASSGTIDNQPLLERMLELRRRKARLLGYRTPAETSLATKMAPGVQAVDDLHKQLRRAARHAAEQDLAELREYAVAHGQPEAVRPWDVAFWAEQLREVRFGFNDEDLRPYFQFPRVLQGLFGLTAELFAVRIEPADGEVAVWHPDVRFFRVYDEQGAALASFYLDTYSRPETKSGGAWMNPFYTRQRHTDGALGLPVAHLVCNQTLPQDGKPSLMTFREVETLFHEFGHGLQHMLTTVDEPGASGLHNVEWDAVELCSQFMENWCEQKATLKALSEHMETGATLPDDLYVKLKAARIFRSGSDTLRQVFFGMLDMELHHRFDPAGGDTVEAVKQRISALATVMEPLPEDRFLCAFTHIFGGGYAAGYYSYKWSEVLSADAFAAFEEAGLEDRRALQAVGRRFRETILALGGGTHPSEVFRRFRGRDPQPDALLRHLGLG